MDSNDVAATILLAVISFIFLVLAVAMNYLRSTLWAQIRASSTELGVYSQVNPHLVNIENTFWVIFILALGGTIVMYVLGSHREEHETFAPPMQTGRFKY